MKFKQILAAIGFNHNISGRRKLESDTANAKVNFTVDGPFGTVHGSFTGLEATINFNEKNLSNSSIVASIDAKTVSTGVSLRNSDLRNKENG